MTKKTRVNLAVVLPSVTDARDACVRRLAMMLQRRDGIDPVHVADDSGEDGTQLCIHYDPEKISLAEVRNLVHRTGAELEQRFGHFLVRSAAMYARQAETVASRVRQIPGVLDADASPAGVLRIEFDRDVASEGSIRAALDRIAGLYPERPAPAAANDERDEHVHAPGEEHAHAPGEKHVHAPGEQHAHAHGGPFGEHGELVFAGVSGACLLVGWVTSWTNAPEWLPWALYLAAYGFGGFYTVGESIENIRVRRFEIDSLMLVAAAGAAALGKWFEGALLLFLFSLGHALEHFAMGRAKRAIEALGKLAPATATVRRDGVTEEVPVEQVRPGDIVIVKPNERLPVDGFVVKGESTVDQAPITGESVPVDKRAVDDAAQAAANPDRLDAQYRVFAGTINQSGALEIQVTRLATESTLARVMEMVNNAETQKSPTQRFTDRFEKYFVPSVLGLGIALLFAGFIIHEPFAATFYRAMAVLVAASPCALAISTPSAVLSGVARAARGGVLVKGGGPLEQLGGLNTIAFDKTGTLTEGKPKLTDVVTGDGVDEATLLKVAVGVERLSDHPLAAAVVTGGKERLGQQGMPNVTDVRSITGRGVSATVDGVPTLIGKAELFSEGSGPHPQETLLQQVAALKQNGRTIMLVRHGDRYLGALGMMDTPLAAARDVIDRLRALGIRRVVMLSGDSQAVADAVAKSVGIEEARGDLMPDSKVEAIRDLAQQGAVAMVGDGVNDAPAMTAATVGIAMGAAGSDVALETADVALMADDLRHLPFAVGLSRRTRSVIRQNLWFSLAMVAFLVPATAFGLQMGAAVLFHEGSTLLVVVNALRLLAYRERPG